MLAQAGGPGAPLGRPGGGSERPGLRRHLWAPGMISLWPWQFWAAALAPLQVSWGIAAGCGPEGEPLPIHSRASQNLARDGARGSVHPAGKQPVPLRPFLVDQRVGRGPGSVPSGDGGEAV